MNMSCKPLEVFPRVDKLVLWKQVSINSYKVSSPQVLAQPSSIYKRVWTLLAMEEERKRGHLLARPPEFLLGCLGLFALKILHDSMK